jgi:hypothetical protein
MTPTPAHPDAIAQGCTCSPTENNNGDGRGDSYHVERAWWIAPGCPLHDSPNPAAPLVNNEGLRMIPFKIPTWKLVVIGALLTALPCIGIGVGVGWLIWG